MKSYDTNIDEGTHTIRVTFQSGEYKGHISYEMGGNCHGATVIDPTFLECSSQDDIDQYVENDCNLRLDDEAEYFTITLKNDQGDTLDIEGNDTDIEEMIVAIEIVDYQED